MLFVRYMKSALIFLLSFAIFFFLIPSEALAQSTWANCQQSIPGTGGNVTNVATLNCIPVVFTQIINYAMAFAGVVALFFIVYSGARYVTSGGEPKAVEGAKNTLTWAIIGLVVIVLAWAIINFISVFTGAPCIQFFGFDNCK